MDVKTKLITEMKGIYKKKSEIKKACQVIISAGKQGEG